MRRSIYLLSYSWLGHSYLVFITVRGGHSTDLGKKRVLDDLLLAKQMIPTWPWKLAYALNTHCHTSSLTISCNELKWPLIHPPPGVSTMRINCH